MIERYLTELSAELGRLLVPRRARRRILSEARDHLLCAAEERGREVVTAFGPAALVAREHADLLAARSARMTALPALAAAAGACLVVLVSRPPGFPLGIVSVLAAQVAATCAGLAALRAVRHRRDATIRTGKLRHLNRAAATAALAGALTATGSRGWPVVLVALVPAVLAAVVVARSAARTRGAARAEDAEAGEDAFDDLRALAGELRPLPTIARLADLALPRARRRPWAFGLLVAGAAGCAAALGHAIGEGPAPDVARTLAAAAIIAGIEGAAVIVCYGALGRWLGIRAASGAPGRDDAPRRRVRPV